MLRISILQSVWLPICVAGYLNTLLTMPLWANESSAEHPALVTAQQVVADFPNHPKSYLLLGKMQQALSQWDSALLSYHRTLELDPNQVDAVVSLAQVYEKQYELKTAVEWYKKAISIDQKQTGIYEKIGLLYTQLQDMEQAVQAFQRELELNPNKASTHYYLAQRLKEDGKLDEAKKHAQRCMELDERYPEPVYLLAMIAREQNDAQTSQKLLALFREKKNKEESYVLADEPDVMSTDLPVQSHNVAGIFYFNESQDQKAEWHFKQAITLDPKNEEARLNLVQLYAANQNLQKIEDTWRELHALKPEQASYMVHLGNVLNMANKWNEAVPLLEKAFLLDPTLEAKQAYAHVLITSQKDPQRGLQLMLEVIQQEPTAVNYDLLSRAYYVNNQLALSIEAMQMATQMERGNRMYQQRLQKLQSKKQ